MTHQQVPAAKRITIVGLGPGAWDDVTIAAQQLILASNNIIFRTLRHPTVDALRVLRPDLPLISFDDLYEQAEDWESLYVEMAHRLLDMAQHSDTLDTAATSTDLVYAVPGHPLVGETSVRILRKLALERGVTTRVVAGLSFIEPICVALALDPIEQGLQIIDATELAGLAPQQVAGILTTRHPIIVTQVFNRRMASAAKLALLEVYPADTEVILIRAAGLPEEAAQTHSLSAVDHDEFPDHLTSLYVPAIPEASLRIARTPEALRAVIARLRAPDGCPWDREQTHRSLLPYVLEEAAEVADAIEESDDDPEHLAEELGDLLLQVYLHAEIAQLEETFSLGDVIESITRKLIRRHPHVFGEVTVDGAAQVVRNWEAIKRAERAAASPASPQFESRLKSTPRHLAALTAAHQMQRRAVKAGFDWPTIDDWLAKAAEEIAEVQAAQTPEERLDELGDLLFTVVALARRLEIDAEVALRGANEKFRRRFVLMERLAEAQGATFEDLDRDAQVALWQAAKVADNAI